MAPTGWPARSPRTSRVMTASALMGADCCRTAPISPAGPPHGRPGGALALVSTGRKMALPPGVVAVVHLLFPRVTREVARALLGHMDVPSGVALTRGALFGHPLVVRRKPGIPGTACVFKPVETPRPCWSVGVSDVKRKGVDRCLSQ